MNIQSLELELANTETLISRYASLINSLESDETLHGISSQESAMLIGYRFQLKQQIAYCEFIQRRIDSGNDESLVMGSDQAVTKHAKSSDQARCTTMSVEDAKEYLANRGNDSLMGIGWNKIQSMQSGNH